MSRFVLTVGVNQANGNISIFNAFGDTHVIADVVGWYDANGTQGSFFRAVTPGRILDTRPSKVGLVNDQPGSATVVGIAGTGIPATGVTAIVANVTAVIASSRGYITIWPDQATEPNASSVNFPPSLAVPNHLIAALPASGDLAFRGRDRAGGVLEYVDVILDGFGYFTNATS